MLRISYSDVNSTQRWNLCGQLAGPWVKELRSCWHNARRMAPRSSAVVDLSDVTFIDETGEELLRDMQQDGTKFVAVGVETKHLLENLARSGERPLRKVVGHWCGLCGEPRTEKKRTTGGIDE